MSAIFFYLFMASRQQNFYFFDFFDFGGKDGYRPLYSSIFDRRNLHFYKDKFAKKIQNAGQNANKE